MGITIHFEGRLRNEEAYRFVVREAEDFANHQAWPAIFVAEDQAELVRTKPGTEDEAWNYVGPVRGIVLYPDENCDPVRLEFDDNFCLQEFTKTQFAGPKVHIALINLLRKLEPYFITLDVCDEGEYWESQNEARLKTLMEGCDDAIAEELAKNPNAAYKVKCPDGRIIDILE